MASDLNFVEFIVEQIENAGVITYRKMFGEYALYCNSKVIALICDNQLFVKPTKAGKSFIGNIGEVLECALICFIPCAILMERVLSL